MPRSLLPSPDAGSWWSLGVACCRCLGGRRGVSPFSSAGASHVPPCATPQDVTSMVKTMLDLTYPITSVFSGAGFNSSICSVFKDRQIEVPPLAGPTASACLGLDALGPQGRGLAAGGGPSESRSPHMTCGSPTSPSPPTSQPLPCGSTQTVSTSSRGAGSPAGAE